MALANFFEKDAIAIGKFLKGRSFSEIADILNSQVIGIHFDKNCYSGEAKLTLDLLVRIVARLYPKLNLSTSDEVEELEILDTCQELAFAINGEIELSNDTPTVCFVIGQEDPNFDSEVYKIFLGSNHWVTNISFTNPQRSGNSKVPFGAGASACIGAAIAFKKVFEAQLGEAATKMDISFSLIDFVETNDEPIDLPIKIDIGEVHLVGIGAIGNGALWAIEHIDGVRGIINLIDGEKIESSNLQRYVMAEQKDIGGEKASTATNWIGKPELRVNHFDGAWDEYLTMTQKWDLENVLVAVDSAMDRIAIQSSLPRRIINSYTGPGILGISHHNDFNSKACLACMYIPTIPGKNLSEQIAENLGIGSKEEWLRKKYIHNNLPIDIELLQVIAEANDIDFEQISEFVGQRIINFHANVICGGILMKIRNSDSDQIEVEVPLSFQSALAGILLVSELVLMQCNLRSIETPNHIQFFPLQPISGGRNPYVHSIAKGLDGACICTDEDYLSAYDLKWKR